MKTTNLFARIRQLHHALLAMLLLDGTDLEAEPLGRNPHQLLGGPVGLGQGVAHPSSVPIQELVDVCHGGFWMDDSGAVFRTRVGFNVLVSYHSQRKFIHMLNQWWI